MIREIDHFPKGAIYLQDRLTKSFMKKVGLPTTLPLIGKHCGLSLYPQRVLLYGQKCLNNVVKVHKLLHNKSISNDAICPICTTSKESVEHALFLCDHARAPWFDSNIGMLSHSIASLRIKD